MPAALIALLTLFALQPAPGARGAAGVSSPAPLPAPAQAAAPFTGAEFYIGDAAAPRTLVAYLSPVCPHCAVFAAEVLPHLQDSYVRTGWLRIVLRETVTSPTAVAAGELLLARCGGDAAYLDRLDRLLAGRSAILAAGGVGPALLAAGAVLGLPPEETRGCVGDAKTLDFLNDRVQAAAAVGVEGTPAFILDGSLLKPGLAIGGVRYDGGELSAAEFDEILAPARPVRRPGRAARRSRR